MELQGYSTAGAASGPQALDILRTAMSGAHSTFDVLITDLKMPEMDGIALLRAAHVLDSTLVSIIMTGHGTIDTAVEAMKCGALDYMLKPFSLSVAMPVLLRAVAVRRLRLENATLMKQVATHTAALDESNWRLHTANKDLEAYNFSISHDLRGRLGEMVRCAKVVRDEAIGPLNERNRPVWAH